MTLSQWNQDQPKTLPRHTREFMPGGKPWESYALIGTFLTMKHLWSFRGDLGKWLSSWEDTGGHAQAKHCQVRNPNIQGPFHCNHGRRIGRLPDPPVARVGTTNCNYSESPTTIACGTQCLGIYIPPRKFWLQPHATCSHGLCCAITLQTKQTQVMGWAFKRWLVPHNIPGSLQMPLIFVKATRANESPTLFFSNTSISHSQHWWLKIWWSRQSKIYQMPLKEARILVATHKLKQSHDLPMCSDLGTNCHSMPILQGCSLMHLQGCNLTPKSIKSSRLMQDCHPNWLLSLQLRPRNSSNHNPCQS